MVLEPIQSFIMPIDVNDLREYKGGNAEKVRECLRRRFKPVDVVDEIIQLDEQWRKTNFDLDALKKEKRVRSKEIGMLKKNGKDTTSLQEEVVLMKDREQELIQLAAELEAAVKAKVGGIGNYVHDSVVVSNNEDDNEIVRSWGATSHPIEQMQHHHELLYRIGGYEPEAGAKVAGHRGYFLTGPAVLLNQALINFGLSFLMKRDYQAVQPPFFMNQDVMSETAQLEEFHEALYKVIGDDTSDGKTDNKYLIATSEQPISAMNRGKWITAAELPIKYAGSSTCFRREAGSHGRDAWGIFRVHQFEKIEQFVLTEPEASWDMLEQMMHISEEFYQALGLSYRVVGIVSGELNNAASKKYDLEAWFPTLGVFRELVSCSNCTDYQARAMETRFGHKKGSDKAKNYVHMLNSTLTATERTICCILENYQTETGVRVPDVLQPFMGGIDFMPFVREAIVNKQKK